MKLVAVIPPHIRRRWDTLAIQQVLEASSELAERADAAERRLLDAEDSAAYWRDQAEELHQAVAELANGHRGITAGGSLVVVKNTSADLSDMPWDADQAETGAELRR